jgi:hypothetical protein
MAENTLMSDMKIITVKTYADFVPFVKAFPLKGKVYQGQNVDVFSAVFLTNDTSAVIQLQSTATKPVTFDTDFPSSITVADVIGAGAPDLIL